MKNSVTRKLTEIGKACWEIHVFEVIVNAIIIFLALFIVLELLEVPAYYSLALSVLYLIAHALYRVHNRQVIGIVVKEYPSLDERLQTAYDNRGRTNIIIKDLTSDVGKRIDKIRYSSFLATKRFVVKSFIIVFLTFTIVGMDILAFEGFILGLELDGNIWDSIKERIPTITNGDKWGTEGFDVGNYSTGEEEEEVGGEGGGQEPGMNEGPQTDKGGGAGASPDPEIFGEPSSAKISGQDIKMEMHPEYGGRIDIKESTFKKVDKEFPQVEGKGYETPEQEPVEYRELIRTYFESLQKVLEK